MIDKGVCYRGYIGYNFECEYDKSCDVGVYLDYKNCKCSKKFVNKLVEWTETVQEYCFFTINAGINVYFVYYKYMNHYNENVSKYDYVNQGKSY